MSCEYLLHCEGLWALEGEKNKPSEMWKIFLSPSEVWKIPSENIICFMTI